MVILSIKAFLEICIIAKLKLPYKRNLHIFNQSVDNHFFFNVLVYHSQYCVNSINKIYFQDKTCKGQFYFFVHVLIHLLYVIKNYCLQSKIRCVFLKYHNKFCNITNKINILILDIFYVFSKIILTNR